MESFREKEGEDSSYEAHPLHGIRKTIVRLLSRKQRVVSAGEEGVHYGERRYAFVSSIRVSRVDVVFRTGKDH